MLWSDFKTIDRFYKIEPLNKHFHEVLKVIDTSAFGIKKDDTKIFNEVYYQMTRMAYERALPADLQMYIDEIREDMGRSFGVELVMSMLYFVMSLVDKESRLFNSFLLLTIKERFENCPYWKPFSVRYNKLSKGKRKIKYDFKPHPVSATELADKFVHWQEITKGYDPGVMIELLGLWENEDDRRALAEMIKASVNFRTPKLQRTYYDQVSSILKTSLFGNEERTKESSEVEIRLKELDSRVLILQRENAVFQNLITDLQNENEKLVSQIEGKKIDGTGRMFSLVEIVNYCKNLPELKDTNPIHKLVTSLLREKMTKEDWALLDSIDEEFKKKAIDNLKIERVKIGKVDQLNAIMGKDATIKR